MAKENPNLPAHGVLLIYFEVYENHITTDFSIYIGINNNLRDPWLIVISSFFSNLFYSATHYSIYYYEE